MMSFIAPIVSSFIAPEPQQSSAPVQAAPPPPPPPTASSAQTATTAVQANNPVVVGRDTSKTRRKTANLIQLDNSDKDSVLGS